MTVKEVLKQILGRVQNISEDQIKDESSLRYDLIVTSISFIKIITEVEDYFDIEVEDDDLDIEEDMNFKTFCDKVNAIIK